MLVLLAALYWAIIHQRGLRYAPPQSPKPSLLRQPLPKFVVLRCNASKLPSGQQLWLRTPMAEATIVERSTICRGILAYSGFSEVRPYVVFRNSRPEGELLLVVQALM